MTKLNDKALSFFLNLTFNMKNGYKLLIKINLMARYVAL